MPIRAPRSPARQTPAVTPMAFARTIVGAYQRHGQDPAQALKLAQITPSKLQRPDGRITAQQMELLSGAAMQELDDEGLAAFSRKLPWGSYGMLARASLTSPDLGVALKRWCRHHALLTDDIRLELVENGTGAAIVIDERAHLRRQGQAAREFCLVHVLRNIHGLACWYIDSRIPLQGASFPFPAPMHADAYRHMFPGPLSFDAAQAAIRFDARYLALPLRRDEKALKQMLQRALPLTVLQYRRDRLLVQQVRQALAAHPAANAQRGRRCPSAAYVGAHAAPSAEGGRRQPAGVEGRGAMRAGEGIALSQRQAGEAGGRGGGLSQREEFHSRVPPVDRGQSGGVSAGCRDMTRAPGVTG